MKRGVEELAARESRAIAIIMSQRFKISDHLIEAVLITV
jgi:hypothetical protein